MGAGSLVLKDIAETGELSAPAGSPLRELIRLMHRNGRGAVVLLRADTPVGILTERDVVGLLHGGADLDAPPAGVGGRPVLVTSGDRTIGHALNLLLENNIRRLVVVGPAMEFVGLVTQQDLVRHLEEDFYRSSLRVRHLIDKLRPLVSAEPEEAVREVLDKMVRHRISSVPIVRRGAAVGIVTEKDVLRLADAGVPLEEPVDRHMSRPVVTVELDTTVVAVVRTLAERRIRRVVVVDPGGRCVGVLTERDLVRNLESDYNEFLERKLRYTKEVLNLLPEMLVEVIDTGAGQFVLWANDKVCARFGHGLVDRPVEELVPADTWAGVHGSLLANGKIEDVRFKRDGRVYELSGFYFPLDRESERGRVQLILRDITEEVTLATTDGLTRVYNRRYISEFMAKEAERCRRTGRSFGVAIVDVDDFKRVNDTYGHPAGDRVLQGLAQRLVEGVREYDSVGRYGGEEFLVIMPEAGAREAAQIGRAHV